MKPYSFDRFRRDFENSGVPAPFFRFLVWLGGCDTRLQWPREEQQGIAEAQNKLKAIDAQLSAAERLDPRLVTTTRRQDVARTAGLTAEECAAYFRAYEWFARSAKMRSKGWWRDTLFSAAFIFGIPLLLLAAIVLMVAAFALPNS